MKAAMGNVTHRTLDCSRLGCIQHYSLLVGTDCNPLAGRTEDIHTAGHLAVVGSSFDSQLGHSLLRIVGIVGLVGRIVLQAGKSSRLVETNLLVGCSGSFVLLVLPGYCPPVRQDHLPMN